MDRFRSLTIFKAVADNGAFNRAAEALQLPNAAVTRCIQELEAQLGARLLRRTTRRVSLTPIGHDVLRRTENLLASFEELEAVSCSGTDDTSGEVRLVAPLSYGRRLLGRAIASYAACHPKVWIDVRLREPPLDPGFNEADLTLCFASDLRDSLIARKVTKVQMGIYASPGYLVRGGEPRHPTDLSHHDCLTSKIGGENVKWQLRNVLTGELSMPVARVVLHCNHDEVLLGAAVHGAGIVMLPVFVADASVSEGELQRLLPDWSPPPMALHLVYESRHRQPPCVRRLIDHLAVSL